MKTRKKFNPSDIFAALAIFGIVLVIVAGLGFIVMILWNFLMPEIMLCDKIGLLQALGLLSLISLLTFDKQKLFEWLF